jgi:hypothetical protein
MSSPTPHHADGDACQLAVLAGFIVCWIVTLSYDLELTVGVGTVT